MLIMTSSPTFMPFRVNDLPWGITGWFKGVFVNRIKSFPVDKWPITLPFLLRSLLSESETRRKLDSNQIENTHQKRALGFLVWPHRPHLECNTAYALIPKHCSQSLFPVLCLYSKKKCSPFQSNLYLPSKKFILSCESLDNVTYEWVG